MNSEVSACGIGCLTLKVREEVGVLIRLFRVGDLMCPKSVAIN